jgi:hypothetical protein
MLATMEGIETRKRVRRTRSSAASDSGGRAAPVKAVATASSDREGDWRYIVRNAQGLIITIACCITAIICVWIAFGRGTTSASTRRFQTIDFVDVDGKTLIKFDRETGHAWRLAKMRIPVGARKADGSTGLQLVAGWEEIGPTFDDAVQTTWRKMGKPGQLTQGRSD